jgi:hypothetical protein
MLDVSALGHMVHALYLSHCRNVSDANALGRVHTLELSGCLNVLKCHMSKLFLSETFAAHNTGH